MLKLVKTIYSNLFKNYELIYLLIRLNLGLVFFNTGKGKLLNLPQIVQYFDSLHIPYPQVNALVASSVECFGGLLLILGLATRIVSFPLAFVMLIAILTAKLGEVHDFFGFLSLLEWSYLLTFLLFFFHGAGKFSLDHLIAKKLSSD